MLLKYGAYLRLHVCAICSKEDKGPRGVGVGNKQHLRNENGPKKPPRLTVTLKERPWGRQVKEGGQKSHAEAVEKKKKDI